MKKLILIILFLSSTVFSQNLNDLYFVFLNSNPKAESISDSLNKDLQVRHLQNIESLFNKGILDVAGPFEGGGGIFILHGNTKDEVMKILKTDPAISANRFNIEVYKLKINKGNIYRVGEKYTMTTFVFIKAGKKVKVTDKENALFIGSLEDKFDILLYPVDKFESLVKENVLDDNSFIKKIWIAKESFIKGSD